MANEAYKVTSDVSIPQAIRQVEEAVDGRKVYETIGRLYAEGQYVLSEEISPDVRERAENGELDHVLEPVSRKEAEEARESAAYGGQYSTFVPEHSSEQVVLDDYGHETVPRDEAIELNSAGSDEAKKALEAAKKDGGDERPGLPAGGIEETRDLTAAANEGETATAVRKGGKRGKATKQARTGVKSAQTTPSGVVGGEAKEAGEKAS